MIHYDSYVVNESDEQDTPAGTCGAMSLGLLSTTDKGLVTCPDCLVELEWQERQWQAKEGVSA